MCILDYVYTYVCMYIYIYRERERHTPMRVYTCMYAWSIV